MPLLAFTIALVVLTVLVSSEISTTNAKEHVDRSQIVSIERYINSQIAQSKGCSSVPVNPTLRKRCEKTIDGFIDSLDATERRALAATLDPYITVAK